MFESYLCNTFGRDDKICEHSILIESWTFSGIKQRFWTMFFRLFPSNPRPSKRKMFHLSLSHQVTNDLERMMVLLGPFSARTHAVLKPLATRGTCDTWYIRRHDVQIMNKSWSKFVCLINQRESEFPRPCGISLDVPELPRPLPGASPRLACESNPEVFPQKFPRRADLPKDKPLMP